MLSASPLTSDPSPFSEPVLLKIDPLPNVSIVKGAEPDCAVMPVSLAAVNVPETTLVTSTELPPLPK